MGSFDLHFLAVERTHGCRRVNRRYSAMSGLVKKLGNTARLFVRRRTQITQKKSLSGAGTTNYEYTWRYREKAPPTWKQEALASLVMGTTWYWIMFKFYYDSDLALPMDRTKYPKPEKWTNEELGIPPIDEE